MTQQGSIYQADSKASSPSRNRCALCDWLSMETSVAPAAGMRMAPFSPLHSKIHAEVNGLMVGASSASLLIKEGGERGGGKEEKKEEERWEEEEAKQDKV